MQTLSHTNISKMFKSHLEIMVTNWIAKTCSSSRIVGLTGLVTKVETNVIGAFHLKLLLKVWLRAKLSSWWTETKFDSAIMEMAQFWKLLTLIKIFSTWNTLVLLFPLAHPESCEEDASHPSSPCCLGGCRGQLGSSPLYLQEVYYDSSHCNRHATL